MDQLQGQAQGPASIASKVRGRLTDAAGAMRGDGLRARALRGSGWTLGGFGASQVLRLVSNLILTRLLFPEAFGLMSLATVFMAGLQMFSDIGIRPSIIQNKRGEEVDFLNTAWTMQVIRGFVLWAAACALAYPISRLYGSPILLPMLCVIGSTAAIRGFQTTGYATKNRRIELGRLTLVEVCTNIAGIIVMVVWAYFQPTVWALVGGGVFSAILSVALGHVFLSTHTHRFDWDRSAVQELVKFGKWIFLSSIVTFLAQSGDRALLPKVLGVTDLAYYSLAFVLSQMPIKIFKQLASKVLFPVYSEILARQDTSKLRRVIGRFFVTSSPVFIFPLFMMFSSEWLIGFMYDARYAATAGVLSILAIGSYFAILRAGQSGLLLAAGNSRGSLVINLTQAVAGLPLAAALGSEIGLEGFCVGIVVSEATAFLVQRYLVRRTIGDVGGRWDSAALSVLLAAVCLKSWLVISV
ncbi:MAG: oligosaccharide flippase family protein [Phycisphaerales bacterium JB052]